MIWERYIPSALHRLYEIHDYHHAAAILSNEFPDEFAEICDALLQFRFTLEDLRVPGGNESNIPRRFARILRPLGWKAEILRAKVVVDDREIRHSTHKIDYVKNRVAVDVEWNSKDQTFDRDLYAFAAFFDYDKISVGVLVTRSNELDPLFAELGEYVDKHGERRRYKDKYGMSTTHIGKLIPRLEAGRNGGCPVLVLGISPELLTKEQGNVQA